MLEKAKNHDMDKLTCYLIYPKKTCSKIHRENNAHHVNNIYKDMFDYIEMVFDWESARYSKDDKPLNAYDTLYTYYPEYEEKILPITDTIISYNHWRNNVSTNMFDFMY